MQEKDLNDVLAHVLHFFPPTSSGDESSRDYINHELLQNEAAKVTLNEAVLKSSDLEPTSGLLKYVPSLVLVFFNEYWLVFVEYENMIVYMCKD